MREVDFGSLEIAKKQREEVLEQPKEGDQEIIEIGKKYVKIRDYHNGQWHEDIYDDIETCMSCNREDVLFSGRSGGCVICDGFMTEAEYQKHFGKKELTTFEEPTVSTFEEPESTPVSTFEEPTTFEEAKPTPKKDSNQYPLQHIDIDETTTSLVMIEEKAKQRILTEINLLNFTIDSILKPSDFHKGKICRSGVHKIQLILNISTEIVEEKYWKEENQWIAKYKVKAIAPNGRYTEAIGVCEQREKGNIRSMHDTLATAQTRATSRAVLDLAYGAVSKEEME